MGRHPLIPWAIRAVAASAAVLCGVLLWQSLRAGGGGVPGCAPGSGCDTVLSSGWSRVAGVPIAAPALVVYAVMLGASLHIGPGATEARRRGAWLVLIVASYAAALAAVWFTAIQLVNLGVLCKWCTAVHAHGVVLAAVVFGGSPYRGRPAAVAACAAVRGVAGLVGVLVAAPPPPVRVGGGGGGAGGVPGGILGGVTLPAELASLPGRGFAGGSVRLDPAQFPLLGSPEAEVVIVELFDYTCPGCRRLHAYLEAARGRYGERLAIVALPVPLDADCNPMVTHPDPAHETACELATVALATWRVLPGAFAELHGWLLEGDAPPTPEAARARAASLVGAGALGEAMRDPAIADLLGRTIRLYQVTDFRGGALPRLLTEDAILSGRPPTVEAFFQILEEETGLESPREQGH